MTTLLLMLLLTPAHLDALYAVESGGKDGAVGRSGEVSRYQIMPAVWKQYARRGESPWNPVHARNVATRALKDRIGRFEKRMKRQATDFEIYLLWHRPSRVTRPWPVEAERAKRFSNAVKSIR